MSKVVLRTRSLTLVEEYRFAPENLIRTKKVVKLKYVPKLRKIQAAIQLMNSLKAARRL